MSLKGNQGTLHEDVETWFTSTLAPAISSVDLDAGHGRIGLRSIIAVSATRELKDKTEAETRYFISSLDGSDPARLGSAVRAHWSVENNLHWVLDVAFDEDRTRTRIGNSAANLGIVRHIALNLIKNEKSNTVGVKTKRAKAGWSNLYLLKILGII